MLAVWQQVLIYLKSVLLLNHHPGALCGSFGTPCVCRSVCSVVVPFFLWLAKPPRTIRLSLLRRYQWGGCDDEADNGIREQPPVRCRVAWGDGSRKKNPWTHTANDEQWISLAQDDIIQDRTGRFLLYSQKWQESGRRRRQAARHLAPIRRVVWPR